MIGLLFFPAFGPGPIEAPLPELWRGRKLRGSSRPSGRALLKRGSFRLPRLSARVLPGLRAGPY